MKVALINPFKFQGALIKKNEPVGLNYLKHYANKYGYTVDVFDFETIEYVDDKSILKDISSSYDIIGISCYYPFLPEKLASQIKAMKSNIIILAGGSMASLKYRELLYKNSPIDYVIINEGEKSLVDLLDTLKNNKPLKNMRGVATYIGNEVFFKPRKFIEDLDEVGFPSRKENYYAKYIPTIVTSRGCNGKCRFCSTRYMGRWRARSPINVYNEILYIINKHNQYNFQFVEPNFLEDIDRALEISFLLLKLDKKICFDFACRIDSIIGNEKVLLKLKEAGAIKVLLGIENFSNETLHLWNKEITFSQIKKAIHTLDAIKLNYSISLILFHPNVTKEELIENLIAIENLNVIDYIENLYNYLRLIPGTALNKSTETKEWSFKDKEVAHIFQNCTNYENNRGSFLYNDILLELEKKENYKKFKKHLIRLSNIEEDRFFFLKEELGINANRPNLLDKSIDLKFNLNKNVSIIYFDKSNSYEIINNNTGLKYLINSSALRLIEFLLGTSFNRMVNSINKMNFIDKKSICSIMPYIEDTIINKIIEYEVI